MLLVHPSMKQQLAQRFDKYIFPADKVKVCPLVMFDLFLLLPTIGPCIN